MRAGTSRPIVAPEEPLDLGHYGSWLAWLREISVATDFHGLLTVRCQGVGGQRDDGDGVGRGIVLEHLRCFPPVNDRNGDVHQDQVGLLGPGLTDALLAI